VVVGCPSGMPIAEGGKGCRSRRTSTRYASCRWRLPPPCKPGGRRRHRRGARPSRRHRRGKVTHHPDQ
jgi:hypothetical protein